MVRRRRGIRASTELSRARHKLYAIEIPSNTFVRPVRRDRKGAAILGTAQRVSDLARATKKGSWNRVFVKDGSKEPIYVQAAGIEVRTKEEAASTFDVEERLVITRTLGHKTVETKYVITNAPRGSIAVGAIVRALMCRHVIEELFERAKGEAGLKDYEVRSWIGWHHHMTLALCWPRGSWSSNGADFATTVPAMTVQQVAIAIERRLRDPNADLDVMAQDIGRELARIEKARINHWRRHGRMAPPRRAARGYFWNVLLRRSTEYNQATTRVGSALRSSIA